MPNIWSVVFHFAKKLTLTRAPAPSSDIHSRNAETVISRPMMIAATAIKMTVGSFCTKTTNAVVTISLSATGSRNAPKLDV